MGLRCWGCTCPHSFAGYTVLHLAVASRNVELFSLLLDHDARRHNGRLLNLKDSRSYAPLHMACNNGEEAMLRALLETKSCDVLLSTSDNSNALHYSARNHHVRCVAMLLEHCTEQQREALTSGADREGYTPLHSTVMNKAKVSD